MYKKILNFCFKEMGSQKWFEKDLGFDQVLRERFTNVLEQAAAAEFYTWRTNPQGRLAEIIILDQFSRNIYRNTPNAFSQDAMALTLAQEAVAAGVLQELKILDERRFLLMPYMHSESKLIHQQAELLFKQFTNAEIFHSEMKHKVIIDRFGRYPHRNKALGRETTEEEKEFLKQQIKCVNFLSFYLWLKISFLTIIIIMTYIEYLNLQKQYPQLKILNQVDNKKKYPIYLASIFNSPTAPTLIITAGCHGLEEIGCKISLSFLNAFMKYNLQNQSINLFVIPVLNPYGLITKHRSNINGVDLMRNGPVKKKEKSTFFFGGHNWSSLFPFYRGTKLQPENKILISLMEEIYAKTNDKIFYIDIHSGFGSKNIILLSPSSKLTRNKKLFSIFINQAQTAGMKVGELPYLIQGDMLDYLYNLFPKERSAFATIEIGTWKYLRRHPWLIFKIKNWFNPPKKYTKEVVELHTSMLINMLKDIMNRDYLIK